MWGFRVLFAERCAGGAQVVGGPWVKNGDKKFGDI